jgi:hypothetical protein
MAAPKDYQVIKRKPPFLGLSLANEFAEEANSATVLSNVDFKQKQGAPEDSVIGRRPGWYKLQGFSTKYTALTGYKEPASYLKEPLLSTLYGAQLYSSLGVDVWVPVVVAYSCATPAVVAIRKTDVTPYFEVTVNGVAIASPTTLTDFTTTLAGLGITIDTTYVSYAVTGTTLGDYVLFSTVEVMESTAAGLVISGRAKIPTYPVASFVSSSTALSQVFSEYPTSKTEINPFTSVFCLANTFFPAGQTPYANNTSLGGSVVSDGQFVFQPNMTRAYDPSLLALTGGASYYGVALQPIYTVFPSASNLVAGQYAPSTYLGGLGRFTVGAGTTPITWSLSERSISGATNLDVFALSSFTMVGSSGVPSYLTDQGGNTVSGGMHYLRSVFQAALQGETTSGGASGTVGIVNSTIVAGKLSSSLRYNLYRTKAQTTAALAAAAPLYLVVANIAPSSAGTYVDSVADGSLVTPYLPRPVEPEDRALTGDGFWHSCATLHQGRAVFGLMDGKIRYSLPESPFNSSTLSFIQVSDTQVRSVRSVNDLLYCFCDDGIYCISGSLGTLDSAVQKISERRLEAIAGGDYAVTKYKDSSIIFVGEDSTVYVISGNSVVSVPKISITQPDKLSSVVFTGGAVKAAEPISRLRTAYSEVQDKWFCGQVGSNTLEVLEDNFQWTTWTLPSSLVDLHAIKGNIVALLSEDTGSALWELRPELSTDRGTAFPFKYASRWEDLGDPRTEKQFAKLQVDMTAVDSSQNSTLDVTIEYDWLAGKPGQKISFPLRVNQGWGNSPWGATPWGDKNQVNCVIPLSQEKHRSMRVIFESNINLAISGWSIEVAGAGAHAKQGVSSNQWVA